MKNFIRVVALMVVTAATMAFADPVAISASGAKLILPDGTEQVVDGPGKWLNNEALVVVNATIVDLEDQNTTLRQIVKNVQVAPGLPQWAVVTITVCLSALTIGVGFLAAKEATK